MLEAIYWTVELSFLFFCRWSDKEGIFLIYQ